jgi:DNA-binding transcriptional LysR family regulator
MRGQSNRGASPVNIEIVRTFAAVVDQGSFAGAARALGLSQSAVTTHIQALERDLGHELFDRRQRPPRLTAKGLAAVARARSVLAALDDLKAGTARADSIEGRLRLGAVGSVLTGVLPRVLTAMRMRYPGLHVEVVSGFTETLLHQVDQRRLDAALISDHTGTDRGLLWRPLMREPLVLIAPIGSGAGDARQLAQDYPFIRYSPNASLGRLIDRALRAAKLEVRDAMQLDWIDAIEAMVEHGHGISLVPKPLFPGPRRDGLRTLPFGAKPSHRIIGLVEPLDSAKQTLTDAVAAEVRALVAATAARPPDDASLAQR